MYGELFALASVFCFVISNVIFRKVEEYVSPIQINAIRTIIGTITYIIIAAIIGKFLIIFSFPPMLWFWLCLSFLFAQVFGDTAYFKTQEMLGTTIALAIAMVFPIFTTILSILILHTSIPYYFFISMVLIIGGVLAIGFGKNKQNKSTINEKTTITTTIDNDQENNEISNLKMNSEDELILVSKNKTNNNNQVSNPSKALITPIQKSRKILLLAIGIGLLAAISWAIGAILTEKALNIIDATIGENDYNSLLGNVVRFPVAAALLSLMSIGGRRTKIKTWGKMTWIWLILGALIGTSAGAYLYTEAIQRANAAYISIISSSSPFVSLPISWFVNREKINPLEIVGVLLTVSGVISLFIFELFLP